MKSNNSIKISGLAILLMVVFGLFLAGQVSAYCISNYQQQCAGSNLYWYDSCGNQQALIQYCQNGCYNNSCQNNYNSNYNYNNNCTSDYQQRCLGNNLYWYDSCGNQESISQYCPNGCYNNSCQNNNNYNYNNYNNYNNGCTYHAYKLCSGNSIYWYDSCGNQQDLYTSCGGQTCQYGQCVAYIVNPVLPPVQTQPIYVVHYKTACYGNSIYWYDSLGASTGLYKNCTDSNSCTKDSCAGAKCSNVLKCDGSTCTVGSADYNTYCLPVAQPGATTTPTTPTSGLSVSFFAKQSVTSAQWQKLVQAGSNGTVYFMVSVLNNSSAQINNVNVSASIPSQVSSLGNLQLNGVAVSGDIVSGINIGSLPAGGSKSITFEGKTQTISSAATAQATATSNVIGYVAQSDSVSINFSTNSAAATTASKAATSSGFVNFLKRWYLWILGAIVLIFLFVVVFRRLSSNV